MHNFLTFALENLANWVILYIALVINIFVFFYGFVFAWRLTAGGRSIMYFVSSLDLLILLAGFRNWFPEWSGWTVDLSRDVVYLAIAFAVTRMVVILFQRNRSGGKFEINVDARAFTRRTK